MKEQGGVGEGTSPEQLRKQKARVVRSGLLLATLVAAVVQGANLFFVEVAEYKQLKETLNVEVDRGSDGTIDEVRTLRSDTRMAWVPRKVSTLRYAASLLSPGEAHALIVNAGENFLVDAWQNLVELEVMKYHGMGTGVAAPAEGDTGLGTELTTQYNPDSTRCTGTTTEGASTNVFRTVCTISVDATVTIGEWGLFNQAATAGGIMWSRVLVSPTVGLNSGDSVQFTYDMTAE